MKDIEMDMQVKVDDLIQIKNGNLYIKNIKRLEVSGKDILPDLLRIIKENPKP